MAKPHSHTELDAEAPSLLEFPACGCLTGHPIGWGAAVRLALGIVVTS